MAHTMAEARFRDVVRLWATLNEEDRQEFVRVGQCLALGTWGRRGRYERLRARSDGPKVLRFESLHATD